MRYIGNKTNILDTIWALLAKNGVEGESFFDFFSGTAGVARYFKRKGYRVRSSDILYLSYCLQKCYIENNATPAFGKLPDTVKATGGGLFSDPLDSVLAWLDGIEPVQGFIYHNYTPDGTAALTQPRMYFSGDNGAKIDAIRQQIEVWRTGGQLEENEYYILLSCLIESVSFYANVAGVYAAFHKQWDPRAVKPLHLRRVELLDNGKQNEVYQKDSIQLLDKTDTDILYLDPPYNQRQYLPNYHLIETIAVYDNPIIKGVAGTRCDEGKKSDWCNARKALACLDEVAAKAKARHIVLSYNSEGIMSQELIMQTLAQYGKVRLEQFEHARFKSNTGGLAGTKKNIHEQLYILTK